MNARTRLWCRCILLAAWLSGAGAASAAPVGSGFTYQGELLMSGVPANGSFDLQFALYPSASGGSALDVATMPGVAVRGGRFAALLDFTAVPFEAGEAMFLELRVRQAGGGSYQTLLPRQGITPAPFALSSARVQPGGVDQAAIAPAAVGAAQLATGAVGSAQLADGAVTGAKIAGGSVTAAKIAMSTITPQKLAFAVGDITSVTAAFGLDGGGTSGDVAVSIDPAVVQRRITGVCAAGTYLRGVHADGSVLCEPLP